MRPILLALALLLVGLVPASAQFTQPNSLVMNGTPVANCSTNGYGLYYNSSNNTVGCSQPTLVVGATPTTCATAGALLWSTATALFQCTASFTLDSTGAILTGPDGGAWKAAGVSDILALGVGQAPGAGYGIWVNLGSNSGNALYATGSNGLNFVLDSFASQYRIFEFNSSGTLEAIFGLFGDNTNNLEFAFPPQSFSSVVTFVNSGSVLNSLIVQQGVVALSPGFAIASLPTGVPTGSRAYVNNAASCPVPGASFIATGAVVCPAFYTGSAWVGG